MPTPAQPKRVAPARNPAHAAPYVRRSLEERAAAASADRPCPRAGATDGTMRLMAHGPGAHRGVGVPEALVFVRSGLVFSLFYYLQNFG